MANYCSNSVTIVGKRADIINMVKPLIGLTSEELGVCVEDYEYLQKDFKRILDRAEVEIYGDGDPWSYTDFSFSMLTRWNPCTDWYLSLSERNKDIDFQIAYDESGCGVFGVMKISEGEIYSDIDCDNEEELKYRCGESIKVVVEESCDYRLEQLVADGYSKEELLQEMMNEFDWYCDQREVKRLLIDEIDKWTDKAV